MESSFRQCWYWKLANQTIEVFKTRSTNRWTKHVVSNEMIWTVLTVPIASLSHCCRQGIFKERFSSQVQSLHHSMVALTMYYKILLGLQPVTTHNYRNVEAGIIFLLRLLNAKGAVPMCPSILWNVASTTQCPSRICCNPCLTLSTVGQWFEGILNKHMIWKIRWIFHRPKILTKVLRNYSAVFIFWKNSIIKSSWFHVVNAPLQDCCFKIEAGLLVSRSRDFSHSHWAAKPWSPAKLRRRQPSGLFLDHEIIWGGHLRTWLPPSTLSQMPWQPHWFPPNGWHCVKILGLRTRSSSSRRSMVLTRDRVASTTKLLSSCPGRWVIRERGGVLSKEVLGI